MTGKTNSVTEYQCEKEQEKEKCNEGVPKFQYLPVPKKIYQYFKGTLTNN